MKTLICKNCNKIFNRKRIYKTINVFCSKSCAAIYNNTIYKKKRKSNKNVCLCGGKKDYNAKLCHKCKVRYTLNKALLRTIKDVSSKGNARIKYSYIRKLAHNVLILNNITKECYICQFDICVDVCHIQPISKFKDDTILNEVNSITNLIYLCPNHHRMLDRDLLSII